MSYENIFKGDVWTVNLEPVVGHEQGGSRPCLIISVDELNNSPAELAVVLPITSKGRNIPTRVPVSAPEGWLTRQSYVQCEMVRTISVERLNQRLGSVSHETLAAVEKELILVLGL